MMTTKWRIRGLDNGDEGGDHGSGWWYEAVDV